mmetsp:Transcript_47062/g.111626  ORF Transcript_47062/g.111626 Transcript_47062/m.111626 type:complete len:213 (-) Transcript_47062:128-766(-)
MRRALLVLERSLLCLALRLLLRRLLLHRLAPDAALLLLDLPVLSIHHGLCGLLLPPLRAGSLLGSSELCDLRLALRAHLRLLLSVRVPRHHPALVLAQRAPLLYHHLVPQLECVKLIMRHVLPPFLDHNLVEWVRRDLGHGHHHCFLRLVADNRPNKDLLVRHSRSVERSRSVRPSLQRALDQRPGLLQWPAREARRRMRVQASRRLSSRHP